MVFVYLEGYAVGAPSYTTCPDANGTAGAQNRGTRRTLEDTRGDDASGD
jgi:hypothetical protein